MFSFQSENKSFNAEERTRTSSTELVSHSSSDNAYLSHRSMTSDVKVFSEERHVASALQDPVGIIDLNRDVAITITLQDIQYAGCDRETTNRSDQQL